MSLPPALLQRLAQRGLVQKQKSKVSTAENEEVIAEDYDEMDTDEQRSEEYPSQYEDSSEPIIKRTEENFWLERMKARMGESTSWAGYKGCPNKYNIWHKCTLFCVNRWAEGHPEPSREYMRRYKRLLRKYPLPKNWSEIYDPGCGSFYFCNATDNLVSWLPPTHPKSQVSKSAATYRRQMEEASGGDGGSDGEQEEDEADEPEESGEARHQREIDDIISATLRHRVTPPTIKSQDFPNLQEALTTNNSAPRKQKSRDLERTLSRQRSSVRRRGGGNDAVLDPMDPSAYSDIPRGKWSDGLQTGSEERKKATAAVDSKERVGSGVANVRDRHDSHSEDED